MKLARNNLKSINRSKLSFGLALAFGGFLPLIVTWENRYFVGDDLEVLNGVEGGRYLSTWRDVLLDASLSKWRPLNNLYLFVTLRIFGSSYPWFQLVNSTLLVLLGSAMYFCFRRVSSEKMNLRLLIPGVIAVLLSPFTMMGRLGVFGFLEFGSLSFLVISLALFCAPSRKYDLSLSVLFFCLSALVHERYLIVGIALIVAAIWKHKDDKRYATVIKGLCFFKLFWIYTTVLVLRINPLKGGGETAFDSSVGQWFFARIVDSVLFLFSGLGTTVFYHQNQGTVRLSDDQEFLGMPIKQWSLATLTISVITPLIYLGLRLLVRSLKTGRGGHQPTSADALHVNGLDLFVLTFSGSLLVLPASSVISRVEMRWLFGSFSLIVLALAVVGCSRSFRGVNVLNLHSVIVILLLVNCVGWLSFRDFVSWREQTYKFVYSIEKSIGGRLSSDHFVFVVLDDDVGYLAWSTNYGAALSDSLSLEPEQVQFLESWDDDDEKSTEALNYFLVFASEGDLGNDDLELEVRRHSASLQ